ncbi:YkuS family protein [Thermohalobacter berrensis]|uniref:YkuS family protein n=1 Tax=Thermohalobacter berrensis TaxID=99594 RepID=A0A419T1Z5_9FIRM|nr:YkuS family protein [Thermohalobacter berrensis]RKD31448.1 hypothetical protein BET03_12585 [Thermohalobacter berrensis]
MNKKIAIEDTLGNVRNFLVNQGYQVSNLSQTKNNLDQYDAVIVSGQDDNFMGIRDTVTKTPVINASGRSPVDIYDQLKNTLE